jgi:cytochrome c-type biogenesis protein CcmH
MFKPASLRRTLQAALLFVALIALLGAGDDARFNRLGHQMMCACGCNQILLECNHVGCRYSDNMRGELMAAIDRGDNDDLVMQSFVQKYGSTVIAAPSNTGFDRVAWIVPYLALVLGIFGVGFLVRAWRSRPLIPTAATLPAVSGAALDRFRDQARKDTDL